MKIQDQQLALQAKRQDYFNFFDDGSWTTRSLTTALAIVNNVLGTVGMDYKAIAKTEGEWRSQRRGMNWLTSLYREGQAWIAFGIASTSTTIEKYWGDIASSRPNTLRDISKRLEKELGLFTVISPGYQKGYREKGFNKCREYHNINVAALLVAHEQIEEVLFFRGAEIFPDGYVPEKNPNVPKVSPKATADFPKHRAHWGRVLFNAFFKGVAEYRRGEKPLNFIEGTEAFDEFWGLADPAEEPEAESEPELPAPPELSPDERCAQFTAAIAKHGTDIIEMIADELDRHPEWNLWIYGKEVVWVPF